MARDLGNVVPWKERYRVDNVPWPIRPFWFAASVALGVTQYLVVHAFPHLTSRIEIRGDLRRETPAIYAIWHGEVFAMFTAFGRFPGLVVINHPLWYMKRTHVMLNCFGVKRIFLGSTGHGGREAAQRLAAYLRENPASSFINPDGPVGPWHDIKKGVFHLALQSGRPIIPVAISARPAIRLGGWDRKLIPLPFSRIVVTVGEPIFVPTEDFSEAAKKLRAGLDAYTLETSP